MKKIMKIVFAILVFIPILVCAETYTFNKGLQEANSHINSTKYSTRNKYLLLNNNLSFVMNDNGSMSYDSRFINGGFLNYREYCLTVGNNSCNGKSYIIIPGSYWTGSGSPTDRYYVDINKVR